MEYCTAETVLHNIFILKQVGLICTWVQYSLCVCYVLLLLYVISLFYLVKNNATRVVALERVGVDESRALSINGNAARSFSRDAFLVFLFHELLAEVALVEIEVQRVHRYQPGVQHRVRLVRNLFEKVAVYEAAPLARVGVEVQVQVKLPGRGVVTHGPFLGGVVGLFELLDDGFYCIDGGLLLEIGEVIVPVQVLS